MRVDGFGCGVEPPVLQLITPSAHVISSLSGGWNNLLGAICGTFNLNNIQQNKVPPKPQNTRKSLNCRGSTPDPAGGAYNSLDPLSVF